MTGVLNWNFDTSNIPRDCAVLLACGDGEQPIAWMRYPEHPYKAMAAMSAPQPVTMEA